ncbi:MAG: hypothetical protein BJ554DRAFT_8401, partial [Olpidium bornovanus]
VVGGVSGKGFLCLFEEGGHQEFYVQGPPSIGGPNNKESGRYIELERWVSKSGEEHRDRAKGFEVERGASRSNGTSMEGDALGRGMRE